MSSLPVATPIAEQYLRLHLCHDVGSIRFANLLLELGGIDAVLKANVTALSRVRGVGVPTAENIKRGRETSETARQIELAGRCNARILCLEDAEYPPALRGINDPPACIFVKGSIRPTDAIAFAIVGSRRCTRYGAEQAERFGALLANAGLTIVSGMARGIDSHGHLGALAAAGRTIAVMGCGLSHLYPPDAAALADRILANGAIISELPMDIAPDAKNFPPRNRIIVGMSLGLLVVEAALRSGALISARLALEYNREVFAVPGQIDRPHSAGCHKLIKTSGAKLVTHLDDILEELGETGATLLAQRTEAEPPPVKSERQLELPDHEATVLSVLETEPVSIEVVSEESELPPGRVASALTGLQLKGLVRCVGGDLYERIRRGHST